MSIISFHFHNGPKRHIGQVLTSPFFQSKNTLRGREGPQGPGYHRAKSGALVILLHHCNLDSKSFLHRFYLPYLYPTLFPKNWSVSFFLLVRNQENLDFPTRIQLHAGKMDYHTMPLWWWWTRKLPKVYGFISKWSRDREIEKGSDYSRTKGLDQKSSSFKFSIIKYIFQQKWIKTEMGCLKRGDAIIKTAGNEEALFHALQRVSCDHLKADHSSGRRKKMVPAVGVTVTHLRVT